MKKILTTILFLITINLTAQNTINQNGLQSTVTNTLSASGLQAKRFEVARLIYNSHHWQNSSIVIIELYNVRYNSGYVKYILELGYRQGTGNTQSKITLVDSKGISHNAKISLGTPQNHTSNYGSYVNKTISIYADIRYYSHYKVKISHLRDKVNSFTAHQQIIINESPSGTNIADFTAPTVSQGMSYWSKSTNDIYYTQGNVGIGTTNPDAELAVNGKIHAKEVKVDLTGWPDFVFTNSYQLPTLANVEKHINQNGHLENIPSAKEVAKNGIELGEMNKKLLQKIEELTLYAIQQDKNNKKMLSIIKQQSIQLKKIEKRIQKLEK